MRYFLDTEFNEKPTTIELISIGIINEEGDTYYAISSEYDFANCDEWVVENVITPLYNETVPADKQHIITMSEFHKTYGLSIDSIRKELLTYLDIPNYTKGIPEFWAYYCAYDWVVFCWIFGRMIDLPEGMPMFCNDLMQLMHTIAGTKLPPPKGEHNALVDAIWNKDFFAHLTGTTTTKLRPK